MPLQGDLKEFGIPEIFQLLEQQAKTGCLHIRTDIKEIEIYFREGMVVGVLPGGEPPWDYLIGILCRVGYLSEEDVQKLRERQRNDLRGLREILRGEGLLGPREIDVLLREHIEELLFPVFQKRRGEFFFLQDKTLPSDWELRESLAPEPLVLEGLRKTDEWPLLKKRVGSFQEVPQRQLSLRATVRLFSNKGLRTLWKRLCGGKKDGTSDLRQEEEPLLEGQSSLSSAEKSVYRLIDGKRNIEEIIHASLLGEFSACQAFLSLLDRGLIRFAGSPTETVGRLQQPAVTRENERANLMRVALVLSGAVVLLLSIQLVTQGPQQNRLAFLPVIPDGGAVCRLLNHAQRDRVLHALDIYRKEKGHYPVELTDLVEERLLRRNDLSLWGSNRFSYRMRENGEFRLLIAPQTD